MSPDNEPLKPVERMRIRVAAENFQGYKSLEDETDIDDDVTGERGDVESNRSNNNNKNNDDDDDNKRKSKHRTFSRFGVRLRTPYLICDRCVCSETVDEVLEQVRPADDAARRHHAGRGGRTQRRPRHREAQV